MSLEEIFLRLTTSEDPIQDEESMRVGGGSDSE